MCYYLYDSTGRYNGTSSEDGENRTKSPPDQLTIEWTWKDGSWEHNLRRIIGPIEFKLRFNAWERLAIQAARSDNPVVADFYSMLDDVRLTYVHLDLPSVAEMVGYLAYLGLIAPGRVVEILYDDI